MDVPVPVPAPLRVQNTSLPMALAAAAILLSGCATDRIREVGRAAPACGMNSVLYCEIDVHRDIESCGCVRRGEVRVMLRSLARR